MIALLLRALPCVLLAACVAAAERPPYVYPQAPVDPQPKLAEGQILRLYPGPAPRSPADADAQSSLDVPTLIVRLPPADKRTGSAMVLCPGGSYHHITVPKALTAADALAKEGLTVFFLVYRFGLRHPYPTALEDGTRAMRLVRSQAKTWGLDPARVGVMGMSAGGHLASWLATVAPEPDPAAKDPIERSSAHPDFQCLISPVISMREDWSGTRGNFLPASAPKDLFEGLSTDTLVTAKTPPAFLWHALDDKPVAAKGNSERYATALTAKGVPVAYEHPDKGGHVGGWNASWGEPLIAWLRKAGHVR